MESRSPLLDEGLNLGIRPTVPELRRFYCSLTIVQRRLPQWGEMSRSFRPILLKKDWIACIDSSLLGMEEKMYEMEWKSVARSRRQIYSLEQKTKYNFLRQLSHFKPRMENKSLPQQSNFKT